jgi:methionyl-tRNA formyltransferase
MSKSKKLIFFGTDDFSTASLEELIDTGWRLSAVVTSPDAPAGRGRKLTESAVKKIAAANGIKVLQPAKGSEIAALIKGLEPEWGVLSAYGKIISQAALDLFSGGIINIHPSLLPRYRGPTPIETAILNGDDKTGVSLMKLTAGMDEGPVYAQKAMVLTGVENQPELYAKLTDMGAELLDEKLEAIMSGELQPVNQDDSAATYTKLIKKEDGVLDFGRPAKVLERQVRAYADWPKNHRYQSPRGRKPS